MQKNKFEGLQFIFKKQSGGYRGNIIINGQYVEGVCASASNKARTRELLLKQFIEKSKAKDTEQTIEAPGGASDRQSHN